MRREEERGYPIIISKCTVKWSIIRAVQAFNHSIWVYKIYLFIFSTNTNLDELIKNRSSPQDTWIGIDMSILLVSVSKSNPNIIKQLFSRPICPIRSLNQKIIDSKKLQVYFECDNAPCKIKYDLINDNNNF